MKKFWTALLCFLLAVSLMLSLCACGSTGSSDDDDEDEGTTETTEATEETTEAPVDPIVGTWEWTLDITEFFNAQMETSGMGEYIKLKDFYYVVVLKLNEDSTVSMYIDEERAATVLENVSADLKKGMNDYLAALLAANSVNMTVEEYLQSQNTTMDELVETMMVSLDPEAMGVNEDGYYKVEDNKLYISTNDVFDESEASEITLDGDSLIVKEPYEGLWETMDFVRVK